jgi:type I restriction enzyme S subunit
VGDRAAGAADRANRGTKKGAPTQALHRRHGYAFDGAFFKPDGKYILLTPGHFFEEGGFRDQRDKTKYYVGEIPRNYLERGDH